MKTIKSLLYGYEPIDVRWENFHQQSIPFIQKNEKDFVDFLLKDTYGMFSIDVRGMIGIQEIEAREINNMKEYCKNLSFLSSIRIINALLIDSRCKLEKSLQTIFEIAMNFYEKKDFLPQFQQQQDFLKPYFLIEKQDFQIHFKKITKDIPSDIKKITKDIKDNQIKINSEMLFFFNTIAIHDFSPDNQLLETMMNQISFDKMKTKYFTMRYFDENFKANGWWGITSYAQSKEEKTDDFSLKDLMFYILDYEKYKKIFDMKKITHQDMLQSYEKFLNSGLFKSPHFQGRVYQPSIDYALQQLNIKILKKEEDLILNDLTIINKKKGFYKL